MKKFLIYSIFSVVILLIIALWGQFFLQGYIFDNYLNKVIAKVQTKVPNLHISYQEQDSSFFTRQGKFYISYDLKNKLTDVDKVEAVFNHNINFELLGISAFVKLDENEGNIKELKQKFNLPNLDINAAYSVSAIKMLAEFAVKLNSFYLPFEDFNCFIGDSSLYVKTRSLDKADTKLSFAGLKCQGLEKYHKKDSFNFLVEDLTLSASPEKDGNKISIPNVTLNMANFDFEISSIYALGFTPTDKVLDPSLREKLTFNNFSLISSLKKDGDFYNLSLDHVANYKIYFPYIKKDSYKEPFNLDNLKFSLDLNGIDFYAIKDLLNYKGDDIKSALFKVIKDNFTGNVKNISFAQNDRQMKASADFSIKKTTTKPQFSLNLVYESDKDLLDDIAGNSYKAELQRAKEGRFLEEYLGKYRSTINYENNVLFVNGHRLEKISEVE